MFGVVGSRVLLPIISMEVEYIVQNNPPTFPSVERGGHPGSILLQTKPGIQTLLPASRAQQAQQLSDPTSLLASREASQTAIHENR